jgi:Zn-dependent peptidase ImmA (M78 family)
MDKVIALYDELNAAGVRFYHWPMDQERAATIEQSGKYGVFMDFDNIRDSAQELVVVAHEGGHISTGSTHRVDSPYDLVEKHEHKADRWAIERLIPADELDQAVADGCTELWQLAEHFAVTEEFMKKAVCWYVHGTMATQLYF